jgi:hypothetical protein
MIQSRIMTNCLAAANYPLWSWISAHWIEAFAPATWSNWALVLVGGAAAFAALKTLRAIERQGVSMRRQTTILRNSVAVAQKGSDAALLNAQAVINAERAWITAELGWYEGTPNRVLLGAYKKFGKTQLDSVTANMKITYKNEGRTPAWIDNVYGRMDIVSAASETQEYGKSEFGQFGPVDPIGAGVEKSRSFCLNCEGRVEEGKFLSISVIVAYHDILGQKRETTLGYSLDLKGNLCRQDGLPWRNRNL